MEINLLVFTRTPRVKSRTIYRVAAIGLAALVTQASPGGAASSWGAQCVATDTATSSYCVTSLLDDIPEGSQDWTLRKSVQDANTRATDSATIGFKDALFGGNHEPKKIILGSTLEIKTNITISGPSDQLLTIERGTGIETGTPLITVNPTTNEPGVNKATTEVKIENIIIDSNSNPTTGDLVSGVKANPGVAIQVNPVETSSAPTSDTRTPTLVIKSSQVINAVSETGGAAVNSSGDVRVENSSLTGNLATTPSEGLPSDGGAIKSQGTVTVIGSNVSNNSATGSGGAIYAQIVEVTTDSSIYANSQLNNNSSGGDGGAISAFGVSVTSGTTLARNYAGRSGGAIDAAVVTVEYTAFLANTAGELAGGGNGGAISAESVTVNSSAFRNNAAYQSQRDAFEGNGGAIAAQETVTVNTSIFDDNYSDSAGGAIYSQGDVVITSNFDESNQVVTPGINEVITQTSFIDNSSDAVGGAIAATGPDRTLQIEKSNFESNTAALAGGAIFFLSNLDIGNSEFTGNIAAWSPEDVANIANARAQDSFESVLPATLFYGGGPPFFGGGAIFGADFIVDPNSQGDPHSVSIQDSTFSENSAQGDGGAIFYWGLLQILRTRFEQNWALPAEFSPDPFTIDAISVGSGGAIFGFNIEVTASTFEGNIAALDGGAIRATGNLDIFGPELPSNTTKTNQFISNIAIADQNYYEGDFGNGGAISADGPVSVADSLFTSNSATHYGGAIYTTGRLDVEDSVFGTSDVNPLFNPIVGTILNKKYSPQQLILNPDYNPIISVLNPDYNPMISVLNPDYNPIIEVPNPNYDPRILVPNPNYNPLILVPNPNYDPRILVPNPNFDGQNLESIANPNYDPAVYVFGPQNPSLQIDEQRWILNPDYNDLEFINVRQNPTQNPIDERPFILQPRDPGHFFDDRVFIEQLRYPGHPFDDRVLIQNDLYDPRSDLPVLQFPDKPENEHRYLGNHSGGEGGAIYVNGPTTIKNTNFSRNSSGYSGGAIRSHGSLNIMDSEFVKNIANGDGGAVYVVPSDSDTVLMARNSFIENASTTDGGAIYIYRDPSSYFPVGTIIASLFQKNEASSAGGAIYSTATNLLFNTFEDNKAPDGESLNLEQGVLIANVLLGTPTSTNLCSNFDVYGEFNFSTDSSCFDENPVVDGSMATNNLLERSENMDLSFALRLPQGFGSQTLYQFSNQDVSNPPTPSELAIKFIRDEIQKDFNSDIRALSVPWTAGHLQRIFPVKPSEPVVSADDIANVIRGFSPATMEYAIGSGEYTDVADPDLSGDKTVRVRIKDDGVNGAGWDRTLTFTTNPVTPAQPSVTADDTANRIIGLDLTTMEYAIGSDEYIHAAKPDLSGDKTVKVRVAAAGINPASADTILIFTNNPVTPAPPSVTADDDANTIIDLNPATMEYAIGSSAYSHAAKPDLSGDKTVKVRVAAAGINPASADTTLIFTTNPVTPAPPSVTADDTANRIIGLDLTTMEYAIGSNKYTQAANPDLSGDKTVKVRVAAAGINPASDGTILIFTTNPVTPAPPSVTADDTANVINGLNLATMEYAIGLGAYTQALYPDLFGNKTVKVRVAAAGINPASADTTLIFTTNPVKPSAPFVSADDTANVIEGLDLTTMEYAIGSSPYSQNPSFDFSGDKTVHVRMKDDGVNGAGWDITLTFTTNPVAPQAPILNKGVDEVQETPLKQTDNQQEPKLVSIKPAPIVQSDPPVARPEALVSEYSLSAEELAQSEKRFAAWLAAKQARSQARALAAERRRIQLEALGTKIAATKARGEALKQKSSWINLMKDFQKL